MKKVFKMENLDCAHCASRMETAISKIGGINSVSVNFVFQKLTLDADNVVFDAVLEKAVAVCKKIEPKCRIIF